MEMNGRTRKARFGAFEADLRSCELHKHGIRLKLQDQPFHVLALLLEHPGELVTRDELRQKLWPEDTFVDFDTGLNSAIKKLRDVLGDSAEKPRYIETLPRRGYRFIAPVENGAHPAPTATDPSEPGPTSRPEEPPFKEKPTTQSALPHRATDRRRMALIGLAGAAVFVLLVFGLNLGGWRDRVLGRPVAGEITAIAVLPLENLTGDPEQQYFVDGMTDELTTELAKISALSVTSHYSAKVAKDSKKPLSEIARLLGVDAVLEGAVVRNGDRVRITARVIHLSKERILLSKDYERNFSEISTLQSEIVLAVTSEIRVQLLDREQARLAQARPVNPLAYEAVLNGRFWQAKMNREGMEKALDYFKRALEIDPNYQPAYIGIVDAYTIGGGRSLGVSLKEGVARMKEAARKAWEIDNTTAEAHYARAKVKFYEWDLPGAGKEFQLALELNPNDAQVRRHYGHYLMAMRRHADSIREMKHALALDPLSPLLTTEVGFTYVYARQYPEAIRQGQKALEMEKDFPYARVLLTASHWQQGLVEEALRFGWPSGPIPDGNLRAKEIYAREGTKAALLRWFVMQMEQSITRREPRARQLGLIASLYVELGDKERAFAWLERAYQERDPWLPFDLAAPRFDPLRSDPRLQDLLRRIGLPQ